MLLVFFAIVIVLFWAYAAFLREWLVARWPGRFLRWHLIEDKLWVRSRTILAARLYWVGGAIVAVHEVAAAAGVDWTPILQTFSTLVPPKYQPLVVPALMAATGILFEILRRATREPIKPE